MRTGLIARKLGMSRFFDGQGNNVPVTVLQLEGCQVVGQRTREKDGYTALQLGAGKPKVKNVTKPLRGHYAKAKVEPKRKLAEFRVSDDALVEVTWPAVAASPPSPPISRPCPTRCPPWRRWRRSPRAPPASPACPISGSRRAIGWRP